MKSFLKFVLVWNAFEGVCKFYKNKDLEFSVESYCVGVSHIYTNYLDAKLTLCVVLRQRIADNVITNFSQSALKYVVSYIVLRCNSCTFLQIVHN